MRDFFGFLSSGQSSSYLEREEAGEEEGLFPAGEEEVLFPAGESFPEADRELFIEEELRAALVFEKYFLLLGVSQEPSSELGKEVSCEESSPLGRYASGEEDTGDDEALSVGDRSSGTDGEALTVDDLGESFDVEYFLLLGIFWALSSEP